MKLKINGKEYIVKYTIRALFIFELITKKPFAINSLLDNYIFFYSMILANNLEDPLDWDEFLNALDNDAELIKQFSEIISNLEKKEGLFLEDEAPDGEKKS